MSLPPREVATPGPSLFENVAGSLARGLGASSMFMRPSSDSGSGGTMPNMRTSQLKAAINDLAAVLPIMVASMDTSSGQTATSLVQYMRSMSANGSLAGVYNAAVSLRRVMSMSTAASPVAGRVNQDLGIILAYASPVAPHRTNQVLRR